MRNALVLICLPVVMAFTLMPMGAALGQERKAVFVDQGPKDASFATYREELLEDIVSRDVDAVVLAAAPNVHLDFGGGEGRAEFRKRLTLSEEDLSEEYAHLADRQRETYWDELETALRLGGVFTRANQFEAPYTWSVELTGNEEPFSTSFIIGSDIPMRIRASKYGDVITVLDEDIVQVLEGGKGTDFIEVQLAGGRRGFVHKDNLRSPIDYRAIFEKKSGLWLMTAFIAGD